MRHITVRIACVQLAARPSSDASRALADALAGVAAAADAGARIAVLPECAYPGYVLLRRSMPGGAKAADRALRALGAAARRHKIAVCAGIATPGADGRLRNEAVFFDSSGAAIARHAKVFLWNFDSAWFAPGTDVLPFDTEFGRVGMMICADGRMPEIARSLARRGAWLVLDPTAWVGTGPSYDRMHNPQVEYVMRVRARENALWLAAADKCGSEHDAVHYVGRSMIVSPDGEIAARAGAAEPALIVADARRSISSRAFVAALTAVERTALSTLRRSPKRSARRDGRLKERDNQRCRLGVLQGPLRRHKREARAALVAQGVDALVDTPSGRGAAKTLRAACGMRVAEIGGTRMFAPEPARAAALKDADVILWTDPPNDPMTRDIARTRALENRVFVVVCARADDRDPACVVDPQGHVTAEALAGVPCGFVATLDLSTARSKLVVPGTDAFEARIPGAFALYDRSG